MTNIFVNTDYDSDCVYYSVSYVSELIKEFNKIDKNKETKLNRIMISILNINEIENHFFPLFGSIFKSSYKSSNWTLTSSDNYLTLNRM